MAVQERGATDTTLQAVTEMHNVWALFKSDMKHLFSNVVSCIITIGLILIPSIFNCYNLIACWDVFDNTGNLKVAVANEDQGYTSDLMPIRVNIGDMVVSELRANDQIDWVVTDEDDAVDGASSGKYYAAVVIPDDFSRDMLTFYMDDSEQARITYYSNEKKNAISPKITTTGADTVSSDVNTAFAQSISEVMLSIAESVSRHADDVDMKGVIAAIASHIDAMSEDMDRVADAVGMYSGVLDATDKLLDDSGAMLAEAHDQADAMMDSTGDGLESLSAAAGRFESVMGSLDASIAAIEKGCSDLQGFVDASGLMDIVPDEAKQQIEQAMGDARSKVEAVRSDYHENLEPDLARLSKDSSALATDASKALEDFRAAENGISGSVESMKGIIDDATERIDSAEKELRASAEGLHGLSAAVSNALAAGDSQALQRILSSDSEAFSQALSSPVGITRTALFPSENFGSAMAPFYGTLAVFIGSLLIMVVMKPSVSNRAQRHLKDPKPRQMLVGRFGCMAFVSLGQTTVMGLLNLFFLQVQAVHPWLMMLSLWFSGLVFTFLIYVLVLSFANLGKALAVCLLIVQVTGCGGSYPLQILPGFVQWISPLLPATHALDAMRAAMFGIYNMDYWLQMGELALFLVPAFLIGFALRKPFEKFMKWYVRKVESTKMMA